MHRQRTLRVASFIGLLTLASGTLPAQPNPSPARPATKHAGRRAAAKRPPELRESIARRLKGWLGVPVRIDALRYDLFASTFVGRGIEVGLAAGPHLKLGQLRVKVKVSLLGGGRTIRDVQVMGARVNVPLSWLGRRLSKPQSAAFEVGRLRIGRGRIELRAGASRILAEDVTLEIKDLAGRAARKGVVPPLTGTVALRARRLQIGSVQVGRLLVQGRLKQRTIEIDHLLLKGDAVSAEMTGTATLGRRRLVRRVALRGRARVDLGQGVHSGKVSFEGSWGRGAEVKGRLRPAAASSLQPSRGGAGPLPVKVRLRLRLGKRRLSGTLARWRLR